MIDPALFSRSLARPGIYLANHSLGRPLDQMVNDVAEALGHWYSDMDEAWGAWMAEFDAYEQRIQRLIGWEGAVVYKSSCGQGLRAVLNSFEGVPRVVATRGEFDSLDFVLKVYAAKGRAEVRWVEAGAAEGPVPLFRASDICDALAPGIDLVVISAVYFTTGQVFDGIPEIVAAAHRAGAKVLVDTYHAAGVLPLELDGVDFSVGGNYKYTRGGPGACWLAVSQDNLARRTLDTGWFAKKDTFSYARPDAPEWGDGGAAWAESTPPILPVYQCRSGLDLTLELGVSTIRERMLEIQARLRETPGFRERVFHPDRPEQWGQFVLMPSEAPHQMVKWLKEKGITVDARGDFVRFGPDLLTTEAELEAVGRILRERPGR